MVNARVVFRDAAIKTMATEFANIRAALQNADEMECAGRLFVRTLYHMPLDPACRMVRITLAEKGLPARQRTTPPWEDDGLLRTANPAGAVPVLCDDTSNENATWITPASVIVEFLEEVYPDPPLYGEKAERRAEIRRLIAWFTEKFEQDVISNIVRERIDKRLMRRGQPDYELLRIGLEALDWHLDYFSWLLDRRSWFAAEQYTAADIAGGAYISALDYVDAIAWDKFPLVKEWYARIKSRPAFRPILRDRIDGLPPPRHYADLDF